MNVDGYGVSSGNCPEPWRRFCVKHASRHTMILGQLSMVNGWDYLIEHEFTCLQARAAPGRQNKVDSVGEDIPLRLVFC
jgi:hypothetical protein